MNTLAEASQLPAAPTVESLESRWLLATTLLTDIAPDGGTSSSNGHALTVIDNTLYFGASTGLWQTNGTRGGTALVGPADIDVSKIAKAGDQLFFSTAYTPGPKRYLRSHLYATDGTTEGTRLLHSVRRASLRFEVVGERAFFVSDEQLWTSDGTPEGTSARHDLASPGVSTDIIAFDQKVYFVTHTNGRSLLWSTDGTAAGTTLVRKFQSGFIGKFAAAGGRLYFTAPKKDRGTEIWSTDGMRAGTTFLKDLEPGIDGSSVQWGAEFNGHMYFVADSQASRLRGLWRTDGTSKGTRRVTGRVYGISYQPGRMLAVGGRLFLSAYDDKHGWELWSSDGTNAGTRRLTDAGLDATIPDDFAAVGDKLVFRRYDHEHGWEPWISDGSRAGTRLLADLNPGDASSYPHDFTVFSNKLIFAADDGAHGEELWFVPLSDV